MTTGEEALDVYTSYKLISHGLYLTPLRLHSRSGVGRLPLVPLGREDRSLQ